NEDRVQQISDSDMSNVQPGDLVEFDGEYVGNALQEIVDLFLKLLPYTDLEEEAKKQKKKNPKKSGNPAVRAAAEHQDTEEDDPAAILRIVRIVHDDLEGSAVEDVVLQGTGDAKAVLTLSREFLSPDT